MSRWRIRTGAVSIVLAALTMGIVALGARAAGPDIVTDGRPNAAIVVAETDQRPRMVGLAALELQYYLEKMTGARLPIVTEPGDEFPVNIYVGESAHTERLGVTADGLEYSAFRMVSGEDWLVLLGEDFDFVQPEPWPRSHSDQPRALEAWDALTGHTWRNPMDLNYKRWWGRRNDYTQGDYTQVMTHRYGADNEHVWRPLGGKGDLGTRRQHNRLGFWIFDEGGSLNAVCEWLRRLGVRWYMPGELGEVVPERKSIPLPALNETVRPDFRLRQCFKWSSPTSRELWEVLWAKHLGANAGNQVLGASRRTSHGMRMVIGRKEMQEAHPQYYALLAGERDTEKGGTGTPCLRSEGLIEETVAYCRAVFDHFDENAVSVWPTDGFNQCQCELCKGIPVSDYVWQFVDRVAREVYKTHPDRLITSGAYTPYTAPPESIDTFSPNVAVFICNRGRPAFDDPEKWQTYWNSITGWREKLAPERLLRNENNRHGDTFFPVIFPRAMAKDVHAMKGVSLGEYNGRTKTKQEAWPRRGCNHLSLYVNARYMWDADQDIEALLDEYYEVFYGPAAEEMRRALTYAEANYNRDGRTANVRIEVAIRLRELLHEAREAGGDNVYGQRIQLMLDELQPLEKLRRTRRRGIVPFFRRLLDWHNHKWRDVRAIAIDGTIDDPFWTAYPHGGGLKKASAEPLDAADVEAEDAEGRRAIMHAWKKLPAPEHGTSFLGRWYKDNLYLAIKCREPDVDGLKVTTTEDDDPAILDGDHVQLLLETDQHSWYRIAVNPAGAVADMDMAGGENFGWSAEAEIAAHVGQDSWSLEMRIPIKGPEHAAMDPNHNVVGRRPSWNRAWYFNICRVRVRDGEEEISAFSPVGDGNLPDPLTFGKLFVR